MVNHTKVILCLAASCVNMLVKIENNLFEEGYKGQYDLLLPLRFNSISSSTTSHLTFHLQNESYFHFEIDPLPWYLSTILRGAMCFYLEILL
jgi:hypothetical protein